jgi:hypothetical protein
MDIEVTTQAPKSESPKEMKILQRNPHEKKTLDFNPWNYCKIAVCKSCFF